MPSAATAPNVAGHDSVAQNSYAWLLAYVAFVVYGSLVPLDFHPHSLAWAWARFQQIPMFRLGIESRADWIANGVLFVPVGFLWANVLTGKQRSASSMLTQAIALAFSGCLAVAIEFVQIFFPPRTVSLNDILAECLGSVVGVLLAAYGTAWFRSLISARVANHTRFINLILQAYLFAFVAYATFPYDFVLSVQELAIKASSGQWGWWQAETTTARGALWSLLHLAIEVVTALPIGILVARWHRRRDGRMHSAFRFGLLLGLVIEVAQFFTYSGLSQGLSVLTRATGCWLGALIWKHRSRFAGGKVAAMVQRLTLPLAPVYVFAVLALNGWFSRHWQGLESARSVFDEVHFLPFYYHYFTSEALALISLISVSGQYAPLGLVAWAFGRSPLLPAAGAFVLALVVETSRLFLRGAHPDPTNILIAAAAAWLSTVFATQLARSLREESLGTSSGVSPAAPVAAKHGQITGGIRAETAARGLARRFRPANLASIALAAMATALWLVGFPVQPAILALLLTAFAAAVWVRPLLLVALVPAALPVFDLAPWSGRFYLDEFDMLMLLGLAIAYGRTAPTAPGKARDALLNVCLGLLALSFAISAVLPLLPLLPWPASDLNAFISYFSPFNGLRIAKGLLWALLFWGLLRRLALDSQPVALFFARGMVWGLVLTVAIVLWERSIFGGLTSLASDYRVTGPFSAMHNGGAYIECFLTLAVPFVIFLVATGSSRVAKLFGLCLLLLTTFALMLTFSRNGYLAFAIASLIAIAATLFGGQGTLRRFGSILLVGGAMTAVAIPIFSGKVAQERMAHVGLDFGTRVAHWHDALNMRDEGWATALFGMGLGRYPEIHYWRSLEPGRTALYRLERESDNTFVRFSAGQTIYVEQLVGLGPGQSYRLSFDARSSVRAAGSVVAALCEKWMLTSSTCAARVEAPLTDAPHTWQHFDNTIDASGLAARPWFARGPVKLALFNGSQVSIDIDNIRLIAENGQDLIDNGDFSRGMDAWFSASDIHLPWHTKSLPVALLFDQGWLGVVAFAAFAVVALASAARRATRGDLAAGAAFAALTGFLVVGLFDTLIDAPRFLFLFVVLGVLGSMPRGHPAAGR